jgi:hypothetical protein
VKTEPLHFNVGKNTPSPVTSQAFFGFFPQQDHCGKITGPNNLKVGPKSRFSAIEIGFG